MLWHGHREHITRLAQGLHAHWAQKVITHLVGFKWDSFRDTFAGNWVAIPIVHALQLDPVALTPPRWSHAHPRIMYLLPLRVLGGHDLMCKL